MMLLVRRKMSLFSCATLLIVWTSGCGAPAGRYATDGRLAVFAGIEPLAYLVGQIGGEHVTVRALVKPGQDPHTFEPTPQQVMALGKASIFFKIDMPFENVLVEKACRSNPSLRVVNATQGIKKRALEAECNHEGPAHDHDHDAGEPDPHVWLSPQLLIAQADNITDALCDADPSHAADFRRNRDNLTEKFQSLHRRMTAKLAPYRGRAFYVFHPAFGYLADAYGLKQVAIEAGGRSPTLKELRELTHQARADRITMIFVQPQSPEHSARVIADAIGAKTAVIDGLAANPLADIEDIATKIEASFRDGRPADKQP